MQVNVEALLELAEKKGWSVPELANRIGINYSYLFRIVKGSKKGGTKVFIGLYKLCVEEGLDIRELIFLSGTLSADNARQD